MKTIITFIIALLCTSITCAITDLESDRHTIIAILNQQRPESVSEFHSLFKHYDEAVLQFFDKKNNDSLKMHIDYMEVEILTFKRLGDDAHYGCIQPLLHEYYYCLKDLLTIVKRYIGSWDTLSLALRLKKFKPILPVALRHRGDFSLFWALNHRLHC